jgi:hypothetical protein
MDLILLFPQISTGQSVIQGTVHNHSEGSPLPGVSVLAVSGKGTATDSLGHYTLRLDRNDSIYFSWLGKATARFAVKDIPPDEPFDLELEDVNVRSMPAYSVIGREYYQDSIRTREEYQKIFGYESQSGPASSGINGGQTFGVGLDIDNILSPKANNRALALQERLEEEERDKYIDHRFNRSLVKKITGFQSPALDEFMRLYRPTLDELHSFETEYQYYQFISRSARYFADDWFKSHMPEILFIAGG